MPTISQLTADDFHDAVEGLGALLTDAVATGSSLGFLTPFDPAEACAWWRGQAAAVASGSLLVWVARDAGRVTGTVSLALTWKPNSRHRAELIKLMVHSGARRRGLARRLLDVAERAAVDAGLSLLVLDTESHSAAERLYDTTGWTRYGVVPDYAADPAGALQDCTFFYKRLGG